MGGRRRGISCRDPSALHDRADHHDHREQNRAERNRHAELDEERGEHGKDDDADDGADDAALADREARPADQQDRARIEEKDLARITRASGDGARDDIGLAARREGNDEVDRLGGPGLGEREPAEAGRC